MFGETGTGGKVMRKSPRSGGREAAPGPGPCCPHDLFLGSTRASPTPPGHGTSGWNPSPRATSTRLVHAWTIGEPQAGLSTGRGLQVSPVRSAQPHPLLLLGRFSQPPLLHTGAASPRAPLARIPTPRSTWAAGPAHPQLRRPPDPTPSFHPSPRAATWSLRTEGPKHRGPGPSFLPACSSPAARPFSDLSQVAEEVSPPPGSPPRLTYPNLPGPPLLSLMPRPLPSWLSHHTYGFPSLFVSAFFF